MLLNHITYHKLDSRVSELLTVAQSSTWNVVHNLQKCFWFMMEWNWSNGIAKLHTIETLPGQLLMTSGSSPEQVPIP
jgi:hypothetical protein